MSKEFVTDPKAWPHYWLLRALASHGSSLEIGPGVNPRLELEKSHFLDANESVVEKLMRFKARVVQGDVQCLPYEDNHFDLVCAFDVLQLVENDEKALREVLRVLKPQGAFVFLVPLHQKQWSWVDEISGSLRRYDPITLRERLEQVGFSLKGYIPLGGLSYKLTSLAQTGLIKILKNDFEKYNAIMQDMAPTWQSLQLLSAPAFGRSWVKSAWDKRLKSANGVLVYCEPGFNYG